MILAGVLSAALAMPAFAGQWQQNETGWWYQNDDGTYPNSGWQWIDGKCYYFTPEGYCLTGTTTPDGYTVDASGAWTVNGTVQTQQPSGPAGSQVVEQKSAIALGNLEVTVPDGFILAANSDEEAYFINEDWTVIYGIAAMKLEDDAQTVQMVDDYQRLILDFTMAEMFGSYQGSEERQFTSGTWYAYYYDNIAMGEDGANQVSGAYHIYGRVCDGYLQLVYFGGELGGLNTDEIMNTCVR